MRFLNYTATTEDDGKELSHVLKKQLMASSTLIKLNKQRGGNIINGHEAFTNTIIKRGDLLSFLIDDACSNKLLTPSSISPTILFEDDFILIIDKPPGCEVHPSSFCKGITIMDIVLPLMQDGQGFHPVNRLDKGTSGVMVIAKYGYIHSLLTSQLHTEQFRRTYLAVCEGILSNDIGKISFNIERDPASAIKRMISPSGQPSLTSYELIKTSQNRSLVRLIAHTGRTHQLRLHLSSIGHPLTGDWLYGKEDKTVIQRPALHSFSVSLMHPITGEKIYITSDLPDDILALIE